MSWLDASIAIAGALLVVGLGSTLIRELLKTIQLVLAANGQIKLEERSPVSRMEFTAARHRPAANWNARNEKVESMSMKNGEAA